MFTPQERQLVSKLEAQLVQHSRANRVHEAYYDGSFAAKLLNISTPEHIGRILRTVSGWAGTTVDVLEERLDFLGFADEDLTDVFEANALDEEAGQVHLDAMIYGVGFVSVTAGGDGEPEFLIRGHDAKNTTGLLNVRTRRLDAALTREVKDGDTVGVDLWLPDQIVSARRDAPGGPWMVVERVPHGLGAVPIVPFVNRARTGGRWGKSEITAPLRGYADAAVRTLVSMDVNREFFSAPQRYAIGLSTDDFVGPDGSRVSPWQILTGRIWTTGEVGEDGVAPKLGEFSPQPAGPFLEQIEGLAQLAAAEAGLPGHYFGLRGDQATSADAIRAMEARLVKRAERRQKSFGRAWSDVGRFVRAARGGTTFGEVELSRTRWGNAATPTVAATADAMVKYVQAGILPPNSKSVWDRAGIMPEEQREIAQKFAEQQALQRQTLLAQAAQSVRQGPGIGSGAMVDVGVGELPGGLSSSP